MIGPARRREKQQIAFLAYAGVTPLDLVGPLTVLRNLTGTSYRTVVVAASTEQLRTDTALGLVADATFADVPSPFAVIVPGGGPAAVAAMADERLLGYVRSAARTARIVGATGNGALVLAAAGLLPGRRAAVHWAYREHLESLGVPWAREPWVEDGRFMTAAGGAAGIDMMLALLARLRSPSAAELAQLFMEYDPEPPFGPLDPDRGDPELAALIRTHPAGAGEAHVTLDGSGEKTIAVVLYPGLTALDLVGPLQVFTELERFAPRYRTVVVGASTEPMATDLPLRLVADATFADVPRPDVLVVPGGRNGTIRAMSDPGVRGYVRGAAASADVVGSVCTGSLILGAVGLLRGREATTNWFFAGVLEQLGATYTRKRWIEDDAVSMSAGVSAGIDWALHLVARLTDEATARRVQLALDYDPLPPFGGIDWDRIPRLPRAMRGAIGVLAPVITAKPRRLLERSTTA